MTPLINASRNGHKEIVQILLSSGVDIDFRPYYVVDATDCETVIVCIFMYFCILLIV